MKTARRLVGVLWCLGAAAQAGAAGSLVDVRVFDRHEQRELPVYVHAGRYYVAGKPGNEFQIVLHNRSGGDVLAVASIDGVNVVSGETASADQRGYVLGPWQRIEVRGWRKSLQRIAAFYFTEIEDSYAARTGRPDHVGVIGVAVFRRKAQPPVALSESAEARRRALGGAAASAAPAPPDREADSRAEKGLGTGHGRSERSDAGLVRFERATAEPEEVVTLYYDSHANLVARGVIPQAAPPRDPQPFPARFVPDPPRRAG